MWPALFQSENISEEKTQKVLASRSSYSKEERKAINKSKHTVNSIVAGAVEKKLCRKIKNQTGTRVKHLHLMNLSTGAEVDRSEVPRPT